MRKAAVLACLGLLIGARAEPGGIRIPDSILDQLTDEQRDHVRNRIREERDKLKRDRDKKRKDRIKKETKLTLALIKELYKKAETAFAAEDYSAAGHYYADVASSTLKGTEQMVSKSKERLAEIETLGRRKFQEGELKFIQGDYAAAVEAYSAVRETFPFSEVARDAERKLRILRKTPKAAAAILLADALAELGAENYPKGVSRLREIAEKYPDEVAALRARKRLDALDKDPAVQAALKVDAELRAEKLCPKWMNTADNYILNGLGDRAREFLLRIVAEFPDSTYAESAKKKLAEL